MVQQLAVHAGGRYYLRVQGGLKLLGQGLGQNEEAAHLHAAAGTARTGTNEHKHDQNLFGESRPQVKVAAGKAGGGDDGTHLKRGLPQRLAEAVVHTINIGGDDAHCHRDDHKVAPHLLAGSSAAKLAHEQQEVGVEVDAEQDHEDGHDPLDVGRKAAKAVVAEAKAAGARRTKGGEQCLEQGHSANQQEHQFQHGEGKIDAVQNFSGRLHLGHQLIHLRAGAFRLHQVDVGAAGQRQQREQEHQNAHAADPVGEAAPEQDAPGQVLHGGQDAGTGGGEAGNGLKHGIHRVGNAAREHKGHRAHHTDEQPAERRGGKALPHIEDLALGLDAVEQSARHRRKRCREQEHAQHHPLTVDQAGHGGQQEQRGFAIEDVAQQPQNDRIIHAAPPLIFHDVPQVMQAVLQRDHDNVVAHLDLIAAARDLDLVAAGDAAEQQVLFQVELAQGHTGGAALLMDRKFQRLHTVVQNAVQGLDVAACLVLQSAHILHDVIAGHVLGVDDAAQIQPGQNIVELEAVDLRDQLALGVLFRKQGQQHVFFVDVGQSHEGFGGFQTFREQEVAVGAVLVQDLCLRQGLGQNIAAGRVPLDDADADVIFQQLLAQVIGDGTAAHDKGVAHRPHRHIDPLEELVGLLLRGEEGDLVAVLQHKVTVGDDDPAVTLHRAHQNIALEPGGDLADGYAVQCIGQRKLDQPHTAVRKGIDLAGTGEPQQMGDLLCRCHFRVDDGGNADLLFDKVQLMAVGRVAHTGNAVAVTRLFGKHTAKQVQFVRAGDRNEHVRILNARLGQGGDGRAIAHDAQHVVAFGQVLHARLVGVHHSHVVAFLAELARQSRADLAAAHQNDLHNKSFLLWQPLFPGHTSTV